MPAGLCEKCRFNSFVTDAQTIVMDTLEVRI